MDRVIDELKIIKIDYYHYRFQNGSNCCKHGNRKVYVYRINNKIGGILFCDKCGNYVNQMSFYKKNITCKCCDEIDCFKSCY